MLKYLPRSGIDFLLHIFNYSWSLHPFSFIWKTFSIISNHKMEKPTDSPASFRPISLTSCVTKHIERIILSRLLFFLESNSIVSPRHAGLLLIKFCFFLSPFRMGLTDPSLDFGQFSLQSTSLNFSNLSGTPLFFTNLFQLASLLALLLGFNLSFLIDVLAFFKTSKVAPFESVEVLRKNQLLALSFLSFHQ